MRTSTLARLVSLALVALGASPGLMQERLLAAVAAPALMTRGGLSDAPAPGGQDSVRAGREAEAKPAVPNWVALGEEAVSLLSRYLQIDTTNPPGNEIEAARFFKEIFDREGIEARILESAPGRGNIYARLKGDGSKKALILLNHMDVVPAERRHWSVDPFGGLVRDGYVWGRGALDMKGMGILQLMALLTLKREGIPLKRDVVFLGTADEESGGEQGVGYLLREHFDLVSDAEFVLTEGNAIFIQNGKVMGYNVARSEKGPLWLRLTAQGTTGHGSRPGPDSPVDKLIAALQRILAYRAPLKVTPDVQRYYAEIAALAPSPMKERFQDLAASLRDSTFAAKFTQSPADNAQVRNTIAVTMLEGSNKVNVVPPEASAQLDVRLLPDERPEAFIQELRRVIGDASIEIEPTLSFPGSSSPSDTEFFRVIRQVAASYHPGVLVASPPMIGFTDCRHFRERGIHCYSFIPMKLTGPDFGLFHGNDERVSVDNVVFGTRMLYDIVRRAAVE